MAVRLPQIEELPRRSASDAKTRWGGLVRAVRATGGVAVTSHAAIEVVVVDAEKYREMTALLGGIEARRQADLEALSDEFDRHLAALQEPDAKDRLEAMLAANGHAATRSKAGVSF